MKVQAKQGRPKVSSRETLAEAACELFLERGYDATSVSDITARAGVSRSSFFNYFAAKGDVIWSGLDERIAQLSATLARGSGAGSLSEVRAAITELGRDFQPDALALAISNASAMEAESELERDGSVRTTRIGQAIAQRLMRDGYDELAATITGASYASGVLSAIALWARDGSGRAPLSDRLGQALQIADAMVA